MLELIRSIDPKVDFVFKKLFGSAGHEDRTVAFINAMLNPQVPIKSIELSYHFSFETDHSAQIRKFFGKAFDAGNSQPIAKSNNAAKGLYNQALWGNSALPAH